MISPLPSPIPTPTLPPLPPLLDRAAGPLTTIGLTLAGLAVGVLILAAYLWTCRFWPYANCPRCEGSGKSRSPGGKKFRNCSRCKGTGRRERLGRRLLRRGDR
ncbi:hypothetical protein [Kribbella solani]|uniref:hypothetical protein n=1 Tax=Kribbella solani TaxID=236067 RepID=UPI0029AB4913|nr:hypothetical protein [Kribbella solani]MDX2974271.1 hypothetical protein [Kribbella solani]